MGVATVVLNEWSAAIATAVLAVAVVVCLLLRRKALRGTTLQAPWCWAVIAVLAMAAGNIITAVFPGTCAEPLRFAIAVAAFCPQMALLGAKRPQNRAWQFVVVTLWAILVLPAVEVMVLRPGQSLDVRGLRSWFLVLLILLGAANSLPTRFWLSGLLVAAGQTLLTWPHLPLTTGAPGPVAALLAMTAFLAAVGAAMLPFPARRSVDHPLDRVWMDFRDWFGALWGLRIVERMNATGALHQWPCTLTWKGFSPRGSEVVAPAEPEVIKTAFTNLLRRFVSAEWIAKRMGEHID